MVTRAGPIATTSHPRYRPDIDGLRAIAVLSVVAFHAFPTWIRGGFIGVDIFFVISGFLISSIIFENLERGTFSFTEFYARRIRRIFPALILVLAASYAVGWFILLADEYKQLGKHIAAGAGFLSNFVLWEETGYFDTSAEAKPLLHLWSLGIEEQFYIVWPLLLWLAWKTRVNLLAATVLVAGVSFYLNLNGTKNDAVAAFYSPQTRFWELSCGSLLAWTSTYRKEAWLALKTRLEAWRGVPADGESADLAVRAVQNLASFLGILLLAFGFWRINQGLSFPGKWALVPVVGAVLIISAGPSAWINRTVLSSRLAVWFGLLSFPLYLWHWPMLFFSRFAEPDVPDGNIRLAALAASVLLAWLTYKVVERRVRFGGHGKAKVVALITLMIVVGCVGYNAYSHDGLGFRTKSAQPLIKELGGISDVYDFYDYANVVRVGICHSVPIESWQRNGCIDIRKRNIVLLGDSYAASLYPGLRHTRDEEYPDVGITQLTDGNGPPFLTHGSGKTDDGKSIYEVNVNRLGIVKTYQPDVVLLSWMIGGANAPPTREETLSELDRTIDEILTVAPKSRVVVIGPFPKWVDTLRKQILTYGKQTGRVPPVYMSRGLVAKDREWDSFFKSTIRRNNVIYISTQDRLCNSDGCLTRTGNSASQLTAVDWGHLTNAGSVFLAGKIKNLIFGSDVLSTPGTSSGSD
jgi:peptidoglycan/LPS O-acetylase OafA/YrhL